jgi:AcrR family transcriptional regulator
MHEVKTRPVDGRAARSQRTRLAIIDALLDLLTEGFPHPTAAQIAERAGVSLRLVFHHFEDLESIHAIAADRQFERIRAMFEPIDSALPFERRLSTFVRERARLFEHIAPVRRASLRIEPTSPEITRRLRDAHQFAKKQALKTFERELAAVPAGEAAEVSTALDAASSWENWDFLRRRANLPAKQAGRVMERMIGDLLGRKR